MNNTRRPALGSVAILGSFYDARRDVFVPRSLLDDKLPPDAIQRTNFIRGAIRVSLVDAYESKFDMLEVSPELGGSILAGFVRPSGSGSYIMDKRDSNLILAASLHHKVVAAEEKLNFHYPGLKDRLTMTTIQTMEVTHVVTEIEWGAQTVLSLKHHRPSSDDVSAAEESFRAEVESLKLAIENGSPASLGQPKVPLDITAYSDILNEDGIVLNDVQEAYSFLDLVPLQIKHDNGAKGRPVVYTLLPVEMLKYLLQINVTVNGTLNQPSPEYLNKFRELFDQYVSSQAKLNDYQSYVNNFKTYLPQHHIEQVNKSVSDLANLELQLKTEYARILQDVRRGATDATSLYQLLQRYSANDFSPQKIASISNGMKDKIALIGTAVAKGATYIGYNGRSLRSELSRRGACDAYILFFNEATMQDMQSWKANQNLFLDMLKQRANGTFLAIVDCDACDLRIDKTHLSFYQNGQELANDIVGQQQFLADKSFARCPENTLETKDVKKPVRRRWIKIACPGSSCNKNEICEWICPRCLANVEFGYSDQFVYCDCGRSLATNFDFKCKSEHHGPGFVKYDNDELLGLLKSLEQDNYINILILGETGVGKSTFINAFVNYLSFETLDDAKAEEELNWVIPCSFSTQKMDRSNPNSKIEQINIQVGSRKDERDGSKGASATQETAVYPVTIGSQTIRLIDTPGIGDTRGIQFDKANMADILSTLSSYDDLHGILILLKSNNARLTVTFNFCMKELLTHLHRSAATNMAFGFTNTRISGYTPGDTFGPLNTLLLDHSDVGLTLDTASTYCFDSESFRYLAAFKNGVIMDNEQDFQRSWRHSRDEALRLLNHFRTKKPHNVKSTVSLNGTRQLIAELTKPMAEISQTIRTNIALSEDELQMLKDTRLTGDNLRKRLKVSKVLLQPKPLDSPRTVCRNSDCVEYKDDGSENGTVIPVYLSHCHPICYLDSVQIDTVGHPGLIDCAAFNGSDTCTRCSHHWSEHLHVLYELEEVSTIVTDTKVEQELMANAGDVTLRQTAVKAREERIQEYKDEHAKIQEAAAHFGLFLKKHSITPYNDATIAYLEMLIQDERGKVDAGGNPTKLNNLQQDLKTHKELVQVLTANMNAKTAKVLDEAGVEKKVRELYNLKHFGENLKAVKQTVAKAHEATYRERPYRVKGRYHGGFNYYSGLPQSPSPHPQRRTTVRSQQSNTLRRKPIMHPGSGGYHGSSGHAPWSDPRNSIAGSADAGFFSSFFNPFGRKT